LGYKSFLFACFRAKENEGFIIVVILAFIFRLLGLFLVLFLLFREALADCHIIGHHGGEANAFFVFLLILCHFLVFQLGVT
jgi:hypothetical protein